MARAVPPANDDILHAITLVHEPDYGIYATADMAEATASASDPSCGLTPQQSVWYQYTSPVDQFVEALLFSSEVSTGIRPRLAVWRGRPGALVLEECHPDAHAVHLNAKAGITYYFEVYSPEDAGETTVELTLFAYGTYPYAPPPPPPKNDLFWYAEPIDELPFTAAHVNVWSSTSSDYDYHPYRSGLGLFTSSTLWYEFTATRKQQLDAFLTSTLGDVYVMTGGLDDPVRIAESAYSGTVPRIARFTTEPGVTYKIMFEVKDTPEPPYADLTVRATPPVSHGTITSAKVINFYLGIQWVNFEFLGISVPWLDITGEFQVEVTCPSPVPLINVEAEVKQKGKVVFLAGGQVPCANGRGSGLVGAGSLASPAFRFGPAEMTIHATDFYTNYDTTSGPIPVRMKLGLR